MKKRVFSGIRPTGRIHLGNYLGAVQNYVAMQDEFDCIYCVVDIHALTTLEDTHLLKSNVREQIIDLLAAGLDPQKCTLFVQSHVPEVTELFTLLGMVTPLSWLLRVPTFKEKVKQQPHNVNYGLVGYPGADDRRYRLVQSRGCAGRRGPVAPPGTGAGDRAAVQRPVRSHFPRAQGQADQFPDGGRPGRPGAR